MPKGDPGYLIADGAVKVEVHPSVRTSCGPDLG